MVDKPFGPSQPGQQPTYAFAATGAPTNRTMPDRLNDIINVKDFGAVGDGVTDDTDAITGAIVYAYTYRRVAPGGGATVFFPRGTYRINRPPLEIGTTQFVVAGADASAGVRSLTLDRVYPWLQTGMFLNDIVSGAGISNAATIRVSGNTITFGAPTTSPVVAGQRLRISVVKAGGSGLREHGSISICGAGRDATILRGNFSSDTYPIFDGGGYLVQRTTTTGGPVLERISDLTIWNEATVVYSGGFIDYFQVSPSYSNCRFKGVFGLNANYINFGASIRDCICECTAPIGTADSSSPGPLAGSAGIFMTQGEIVNCYVTGYDIGYGIGGTACTIMNTSKAYRCNTGVALSRTQSIDVDGANPVTGNLAIGPTILSNQFDRCRRGMVVGHAAASVIAANVITGTMGVPEPATIQNISWSAGTATVTTANPHNLSPGSGAALHVVTNPPGWTPDGSGDQIIAPITVPASPNNQFSFPLSSSPGSFTSGTWNYALFHGIEIKSCEDMAFMANVVSRKGAGGDIALWEDQIGTGDQKRAFAAAMRAPKGWDLTLPDGSDPSAGQWEFINCTGGANPPSAFVKFAGLNAYEGNETTIVDARTQNSFGGVVSGGGSNHYKVRYDGTNWIRVG
jgi:Pectate lyase superfamily protein